MRNVSTGEEVQNVQAYARDQPLQIIKELAKTSWCFTHISICN